MIQKKIEMLKQYNSTLMKKSYHLILKLLTEFYACICAVWIEIVKGQHVKKCVRS